MRDTAGLRSLEEHVFGDREHPAVALTQALSTDAPVFSARAVREIVGPDARIYFIAVDDLLRSLQIMVGRKLAPTRGAARIWWPGLSARSDPADHPLVQRLEDEADLGALEEFACRFDLSRPRVRSEIKLLEDARALAERERDQVANRIRELEKQLRDARAAAREALRRAEAAETQADAS